MKRISLLVLLIAIFGLSSCKSGFLNQKYTNLSPIKVGSHKQESETFTSLNLNPINETISRNSSENSVLALNPEQIKLIKKAIADGTPIYVNSDDHVYKIVNPFYDQFYEAVSGNFVIVEGTEFLDEKHLEIFQSDFKPTKINPFIYFIQVQSVLEYTPPVKPDPAVITEPPVEEPVKESTENPIDSKVDQPIVNSDKTEEPVSQNRGQMTLAEHTASSNIKSQRQSSGIVIVGLFLGLLMFLLGVFFGGYIFAIIGVFLYIIVMVSAITSLLFLRKNKLEADRKNKKVYKNATATAGVLWFLLALLSIPLLLLPMLITLGVVIGMRA